jgi:hypothetical protein
MEPAGNLRNRLNGFVTRSLEITGLKTRCYAKESDLQSARFGLYSTLRSEFLKLRRWSLGLRRLT